MIAAVGEYVSARVSFLYGPSTFDQSEAAMINNTFPILNAASFNAGDLPWREKTSRHRLKQHALWIKTVLVLFLKHKKNTTPFAYSSSYPCLLTVKYICRSPYPSREHLSQGRSFRFLPCQLDAQLVLLALHLADFVLEFLDPIDLLLAVLLGGNVVAVPL